MCIRAKHKVQQSEPEVTETPNVICDYNKNMGGVDVVDQYIIIVPYNSMMAGTVQLVQRYATDQTVWRLNPGGEIFRAIQTGPKVYPASYTMGTESFLGIKGLGHGADHPPPSSVGCKQVGAILPPHLHACTGMSCGDLSIYH